MYQDRVSALRESMAGNELGGLVVVKRENVRYLSGFNGDNGVLVVTADSAVLITDARFREQSSLEAPGWEIVIYQRDMAAAIAERCDNSSCNQLLHFGLEDSATIAFQQRFSVACDEAELVPASGLVEKLRVLKDPGEIESIRTAAGCALRAFESLLPMVQPGITERQLAAGLDYRMMTAGADKPAFDTVVASGPNASMPHAGITDRKLEPGDQVVIDFGAVTDGYCCDITRTIAVGDPDPKAAEIACAVQGAWDAAFAVVEPGVRASDVDAAARSYLEGAGFAEGFVHSLGHGIGLEVHEKPTLSALSEETLEPGMVFTIEPGVYLEGETGARHEESVLLTSDGPVVISDSHLGSNINCE
jgi:Xaa-Pro aminopeptidase